MPLIDRSPGAFYAVVNAVLYSTVLLETWMLTTGSMLVMIGFMGLIITMAGLLCRFIMDLMGSEEYTVGAEPAVAAAPAPQPSSEYATSRPRASSPAPSFSSVASAG